jgi:hypothetical protein
MTKAALHTAQRNHLSAWDHRSIDLEIALSETRQSRRFKFFIEKSGNSESAGGRAK